MILNDSDNDKADQPPVSVGKEQDTALRQFVVLACRLMRLPMGFLSIPGTQHHYIRMSDNLTIDQLKSLSSLNLPLSDSEQPQVIPDTLLDTRAAKHRLVTGTPFIRFWACVPLTDHRGNLQGTLCFFDTTPHALTSSQLETFTVLSKIAITFLEGWRFAGFTDPVTALPNRQRLIHDLEELARVDPPQRRRLILIDCIDMPRAYELARSLGMAPVETLLRDMASLVIRELQPGPDENVYTVAIGRFAILVPEKDPRTAGSLAHALQGISADLGEDVSVDITPCTGETVFTAGQRDPQEILRQAVSALHEAIRSGKWAMTFEPELDSRRTGDFTLMNDLAAAMRQNQGLYLVYQPKICLRTGQPVGTEALIRWLHPARGELSPDVFIPLASQTNLLSQLTNWVIDAAIMWLKQLPPRLRLPVTVNVSEKDFSHEQFADNLEDKMLNAGLPVSLIGIECLESERIIESTAALNGLDMLKLRGFSISLDDFGTGYSNISYLKHMPLDIIKIDRSLISELLVSTSAKIVVSNIIIMLKQLDYLVLAEGVEDAETLDLLREYGCDQVQGYFYSRPLRGHDIEKWLKDKINSPDRG